MRQKQVFSNRAVSGARVTPSVIGPSVGAIQGIPLENRRSIQKIVIIICEFGPRSEH